MSSTFNPTVRVDKKGDGIYDVIVNTSAPNSCFTEDGSALELPPGVDLSIPEYAHLVCKAKYTGGLILECLMLKKPLVWKCQDLKLGTGKSHLAVHIVTGGVLVGSTVVPLPSDDM